MKLYRMLIALAAAALTAAQRRNRNHLQSLPMISADGSNYRFTPSSSSEAFRLHYANSSYQLTQATLAHASNWSEQTPITAGGDDAGSVGKLIRRFGEHTLAHALAQGRPELLATAARAGLQLAHVVGDHPRARLEGGNDQLLSLVLEAATKLDTALQGVVPTDPSEVIAALLEQLEPSDLLDNVFMLVERWGVPLLALRWNDERAANRPEPFVAFDWWVDKFPWKQTDAVTLDEPAAHELRGDARARRLATEFARTGGVELGLSAVRAAIECEHQHPAWMSLWVANHHGGSDAVGAFNNALADAGLTPDHEWTRPPNDQLGDIIVTDPWAGPFFDRLLRVGGF